MHPGWRYVTSDIDTIYEKCYNYFVILWSFLWIGVSDKFYYWKVVKLEGIKMILYLTKQTFERYNLNPSERMSASVRQITEEVKKREQGERILEWGGKIFYFDRRKCIQFCNFASKFTVFLIDFKVKDLQYIGDGIFMYLFDFYKDNREMTRLLKRLADEHPITVIDRLKDKGVIATLNHTQLDFAMDGYRFL